MVPFSVLASANRPQPQTSKYRPVLYFFDIFYIVEVVFVVLLKITAEFFSSLQIYLKLLSMILLKPGYISLQNY